MQSAVECIVSQPGSRVKCCDRAIIGKSYRTGKILIRRTNDLNQRLPLQRVYFSDLMTFYYHPIITELLVCVLLL